MICRSEDLKAVCQKILNAVDTSFVSVMTDTVGICVSDNKLHISVSNGEYYTNVSIDISDSTTFKASVSASVFLKLISQITTDTVEMLIDDNTLVITGNGKYKIPMVFKDDALLEIPEIKIENPTTEFDISSEHLNNILTFNSKEIKNVSNGSKPVQHMYYIDNKGCITFTTGACVNNFEINSPVKLLLTDKIVKLFKLFKSDNVKCVVGHDESSSGIVQTKVKFETEDVKIVSIISGDDSLINSVPVDAIRGRANCEYPYVVSIHREALTQAINRLLIFTDTKDIARPIGFFTFTNDSVTIYDRTKSNNESLYYSSELTMDGTYEMSADLNDIKSTIENCKDEYITVGFGNSQAIIVKKNNITNIIPECVIS